VKEAISLVHEKADPDANIIMGAVINESFDDEIMVTLIATGFPEIQEKINRTPSMVNRNRVGKHQSLSGQSRHIKNSEQNILTMPVMPPKRSKKIDKIDDLPALSPNDLSSNDLEIPAFLRKKPRL